jgi:ketosteroid isomerase-like protein
VTLGSVDARQEVINAARARAATLARADTVRLTDLLHDEFRWTSHTGETYSRSEYVARNTRGQTNWLSQDLGSPDVVVVGDTAVLFAEAIDVVSTGAGEPETFSMPVTQVWVREGDRWRCLAGHAGPRRT